MGESNARASWPIGSKASLELKGPVLFCESNSDLLMPFPDIVFARVLKDGLTFYARYYYFLPIPLGSQVSYQCSFASVGQTLLFCSPDRVLPNVPIFIFIFMPDTVISLSWS
jgi:hypothetical protein